MISQLNVYVMDTVLRYCVILMWGVEYSTEGHMVL